MNTPTPDFQLKILIVDDEPLARHCYACNFINVQYLSRYRKPPRLRWLRNGWLPMQCHLILLDIHMPGVNGLEFAGQCQQMSNIQAAPPAVIFVTADSGHALQAFELAAFDYLTKPVSVERLKQALLRVQERTRFHTPSTNDTSSEPNEPSIIIDGAQRISRIGLSKILYFRADSKYVKVVTNGENYLIENSLNTLEEQFSEHVIRAHRAYLVPKHAIEKLVRVPAQANTPEMWMIQLQHSQTLIPVSRRQLAAVKELLHSV